MNFIWINVPQIALAYSENPNSIYLSIQKLFKTQWRTFLKKYDINSSKVTVVFGNDKYFSFKMVIFLIFFSHLISMNIELVMIITNFRLISRENCYVLVE